MKILTIHADYIKYKPLKQAIKDAEEVSDKEVNVKECLVVFTAVEKEDEKNSEVILNNLIKEINSIASQVKAKNIVLYPYAHLSSKLSSPKFALQVLKDAEYKLKKDFKVERAPFGHYKSFEVSCKGHPLSELSREILAETKNIEKIDKPLEIQVKDFNKLEKLRNTFNLVLGNAVTSIYQNTIPALAYLDDDKFYYDFERKAPFTPEDLEKIENKMNELLKKQEKINEIKNSELNNYKKKILKYIKKSKSYQIGSYKDVLLGQVLEEIPKNSVFKLLNSSGVYWKGSQYNKQLQRIYGIAFENKKDLEEYLKNLEELEKRNHRVLGEQLDLFFFHEYSPGAPVFLPKGAIVYNELIKLIKEEYKKRGYQEVLTPLLYDKELWETSGHWSHYKDNMFIMESEKKTFSLKPMNCPSHCLIYKHKLRSYKELPLRIADFAPLHRNELSGTLTGLTRVRKFSQDDAHIFVSEEQLEKEIENVFDFEKHVYNEVFKLDYYMRLGTRPTQFMGEKPLWDKAEKILESILKKKKINYKIVEGEGAFYGPKIDLLVKDAFGREWQLATIQLDFQIPKRFNLTYEGKDGQKHNPIMIHRAVYGSMERFFALIIEHFAGKLPLWLSPVQVLILTITDRSIKFAEEVQNKLKENNIRVELDADPETLSKKIVNAQLKKIPLTIVIGDKEIEKKTIAVRTLDGNTTYNINLNKFIEDVKENINSRSLVIKL